MSGDGGDKAYAAIVADIAMLARKLAKSDPYKSANGSDALLAFADHLEGIVAAVGLIRLKLFVFPFATNGPVKNEGVDLSMA